MEITNETMVPYFVLNGFAGGPTLHITLFVIMFLVFFTTIAGNTLIIIIIYTDYRLHSPMYFFLINLSALETFGICFITPKLLSILIGDRTISVPGCYTQAFFYFSISGCGFLLLSVMSFDRFMAICHPLRYTTLMRPSVCILLVCVCLIISFSSTFYELTLMLKLPFCGYILDHFFCDSAAMLKLVCVDISLIQLSSVIASIFILVIPLIITVISYIFIVYTVMKIPSEKGRQKTFSTCVSHLTMVCIVFGSAIFIQVRPSGHYSVQTDKIVNLVSTVLSPLVNPFIYTLRNQQVKNSLKDLTDKVKLL